MPSYEEIKQEIFAHETPADTTVSPQGSPQVRKIQTPSSPQTGFAVQVLVACLLAAVVCGGTLWYMNGSASKSTRNKVAKPIDLVEWLVGGPKRSSFKNRRRGFGRDQQISVIRQHDPTYGFAETN